MITTLLFDLDNTLYSPEYGLEDEVVARMNEFVQQVLKKSLEECKRIRSERLPLYGTTLEWLMAEHGVTDYEAYFRFVHPDGEEAKLKPDPALKEFLQSIPLPKFILTNAPMEHADRILAKLELSQVFDGIYDIRFNMLRGKPHQEAYERVCADMHASIDEVLFIDDIPRYVDGFTKLGGKGLLIDQTGKHKHYPYEKIGKIEELVNYI